MQLLKSVTDAVGTASGVAWPIFGTISGSLSLSVGGIAAIALGSVSCGIFILIALPWAIWSYTKYLAEQKELEQKLYEEKKLFQQQLLKYLLAVLANYQKVNSRNIKNINAAVDAIIFQIKEYQTYTKMSSKLYALLSEIQNNRQELKKLVITMDKENKEINDVFISRRNEPYLNRDERHYKNEIKRKQKLKLEAANIHVKNLINHSLHSLKSSSVPVSSCVIAGITTFFAGFGTVLGCSAGVSGLLTAMGIFAGLSAVPVVGWGALGLAILFGTVIAAAAAYHTYQKIKLNQAISSYQQVNSDLLIQNIRLEERAKIEIKKGSSKGMKSEKTIIPWLKNKRFQKTPAIAINTFSINHKSKYTPIERQIKIPTGVQTHSFPGY